MSEWGAVGVGQSSWGPTVYGIVDGDEAGLRLAECLRGALDALGVTGCVHWGPFRSTGARVRRGDGSWTDDGSH